MKSIKIYDCNLCYFMVWLKNINKVYPFEVFLAAERIGMSKDSKAQCHQVRTISKVRLDRINCGHVAIKELSLINDALRLHLEL